MAKKAPAVPAKKAPVKRKPRPKKPAEPAVQPAEVVPPEPVDSPILSALLYVVPCLIAFVLGAAGGIYAAGGIEIGGDVRPGPGDAVSQVYDAQEASFRKWSGERAKALRAGELSSEKASADWMAAKYLPESDAAWATLLTAEAAAFGGEQWTAEKEASTIERYAR
jgi:hypothetical protein